MAQTICVATRNPPQTFSELDVFKTLTAVLLIGRVLFILVQFRLRGNCCFLIARRSGPESWCCASQQTAICTWIAMCADSRHGPRQQIHRTQDESQDSKAHTMKYKDENKITSNQLSKLCCYITFVVLASVEPANCISEEDGTRRRSAKPREKRKK